MADDDSRRVWSLLAYGFALSLAAGLAYFLFQMPFQRSDNLYDMMIVERSSFGDIWTSETGRGSAYFRPGLWWTINAVYEAARGHVFFAFKAFHALQVGILFVLFVRLVRVRSAVDLAATALGLTALVGIHTFVDNVAEGFPINQYLSILIACLAALNLASGRPALWHDVALVLIFAYSILTIESGILVLVIAAAAFAVGFRGVSLPAVGAAGAVFACYLGLKFIVLQNVVPPLGERSSGFWFRSYSQSELVEKFSDDRLLFSAYNAGSSILSVLFAEPRAGVWRLVRSFVEGPAPLPGLVIAVATSTLSTIVVAAYIWGRRRPWRNFQLSHGDRLVVIALVVLLANSVLSFSYSKDVIIGPAGLLYCLAFTVALRDLLARLSNGPALNRTAAAMVCVVALLSLGWTARALSVPYELARYAYLYKQDWIDLESWVAEQKIRPTPAQRDLMEALRREALAMDVPPYPTNGAGWDRYVDRR